MRNALQIWLLMDLVISLYATSLFLPAVSLVRTTGPSYSDGKLIDPGGQPFGPVPVPGISCFYFALLSPQLWVWWSPNLFFLMGGVLLVARNSKCAAIVGLIGVIIASAYGLSL